ncbi:MAG: hypothetical protein N2749_04110 [Clostridia bacterium]|nr:hypothetical protein [Clostridia bacterium]
MSSILLDIFDFDTVDENIKKIIKRKNNKYSKKNILVVDYGIFKYIAINSIFINKFISDFNNTKKISVKDIKYTIKNIYHKFLNKLFKEDFLYIVDKITNSKNIAVFSGVIKENKEYYEYFKSLLSIKNIEYIDIQSNIKNHDIKIIDKYIDEENIKAEKVKVLWMIRSQNNFDSVRLLQYIEKFKYVDILKVGIKDKMIDKRVNDINKEYGTIVDIIDKKKLIDYNVYVNFDLNKDNIGKYIINKKSKFIDFTSVDDEFDENYIAYKNNEFKIYEYSIININRFNKLDIGFCLKDNILTDSI